MQFLGPLRRFRSVHPRARETVNMAAGRLRSVDNGRQLGRGVAQAPPAAPELRGEPQPSGVRCAALKEGGGFCHVGIGVS